MTPPNVIFIPTPATGLGDVIIENGQIFTAIGGVENRVQPDGSSTVYNGWDFTGMDFRDNLKDGVWADNGLGLLWNMKDATNYANWQGYIGTGPGTFYVYEAGTTTLVFSYAWTGERQWTTNIRQYGYTSLDYTGSVAANGDRVDVYHVPD